MKDFKLVTEQVDLLKSRGMLFEDEQDAICKLLSDNYYNIINGYKDLFLDTTNNQEVFKTGTTFNEIYALYEFDNQLKNIFLEYILKIENILRTLVAYNFSSFHGNDNYLKIDNFYNIFNVYKDLFLDTTNNQEVFKTGTTFNVIYALY